MRIEFFIIIFLVFLFLIFYKRRLLNKEWDKEVE